MSDFVVAGLILCGGAASRFAGGEKERALLNGRPLIEHVIARARPQVAVLAVSRDAVPGPEREYGMPVVRDRAANAGPAAGLAAGLEWAEALPQKPNALALFACDTPVFPDDHVSRLAAALRGSGAGCAMALANGRPNPTMSLWRVGARFAELSGAGLYRLAEEVGAANVEFIAAPPGAYCNINTRQDLARLAAITEEI